MYTDGYYSGAESLLFGGFMLVFILIALAVGLIAYVISALALSNAAKEQGRTDGFLAWIPIGNTYLLIKLAGGNPAMLFLLLGSIIPFVGIICSLVLIIYIYVMLYRFFTRYNVNQALIIIGFIFNPILLICYIIASKNAKEKLNNSYGNYNNYNNYDQY